jgi:hypothetical protein
MLTGGNFARPPSQVKAIVGTMGKMFFFYLQEISIIYAQTIFTGENLLSEFNKCRYILVESPVAFTSFPWLDFSS